MSPPYMELKDIAKVYGISTSAARKWARADRWRTRGTRPRRYSLADAQQSYEARRNRVARHLARKYADKEESAP